MKPVPARGPLGGPSTALLLVGFLVACGTDGGALADSDSPGPSPVEAEAAAEEKSATTDGAVPAGGGVQHAVEAQARATGAEHARTSPSPVPAFQRPEHIRGIYLNAWVSGSRARREALMDLARRTEVNTFVIDVKDATGYVSYETGVPLALEIGADREQRIHGIQALLRRLHEEGIYPVARIVVFKDHLLARERPEYAVQDSAGGPWMDGNGEVWVNPYSEDVWAYNMALAREAARLGFPEIQWDYIRFPDRPQSELARAVFPGADGRTRSQAIRDFLLWSRDELAELDVPLTGDVFGVAASSTRDVGIGQLWEDLVDAVDAILPMVYPSHYLPGSFGIDEPNAHPYEVIYHSLGYATRRSEAVDGAARVIPWLQDFTLGPPRYEAPEVRAQIQATYDAGVQEWLLWNASGRYTEAALEPVGGWAAGEEPRIRVGSRLVRLEDRFKARGDTLVR
jgi:hypothetical protein